MKKKTAIDMGASVIRVVCPGEDEIYTCPAAVALECGSGKAVGFGEDAILTAKRLPGSVDVVYPLLEPESATSTVLEGLFGCAASMACRGGKFRSDLALSVPASVSEDHEEAFPVAASAFGAKDVYMISGLHAASRSTEHSPSGATAVVHVGASTAEIGIYLEKQCLTSRVMRIGGHTFDDLLGDYVYDQFGLLLDEEGAEQVKISLSELPVQETTLSASGIHKTTGLPRVMDLDAGLLREVLLPAYKYLTDALLDMTKQIAQSPEVIVLTGGSAPICGLADAIIAAFPESAVRIADDPADAVIRGLCVMIDSREI